MRDKFGACGLSVIVARVVTNVIATPFQINHFRPGVEA